MCSYVHGVFSLTGTGALVSALLELWWSLHSFGMSTGTVVSTNTDPVGASVLGLATMFSVDVDDVTVRVRLDDPIVSYMLSYKHE